ncbi:MAG: hypothetical protein ACI9F2_000442, partial [Lysobacterales bacterium]
MKVLWLNMRNKIIFMVLVAMVVTAISYFYTKEISNTEELALLAALKTEDVRAFINFDGGRFSKCMTTSVKRPCDTDWVTCIDEAWVVRLELGEDCRFS